MTLQKIKRTILWIIIICIIAVAVLMSVLRLSKPQASTPLTPHIVATATTCEQSRVTIEQEIDQYNKSQKLEWLPAGATYTAGNYINHEELYKLFYSPGLGMCIEVEKDQTSMQTNKGLIVYEESYNFYNAFTGETVNWMYTIRHGYQENGIKDVEQMANKIETATTYPSILGTP